MFESYQLDQNRKQNKMLSEAHALEVSKQLNKNPLKIISPDLLYARTKLDLMWNGHTLGLRVHKDSELAFEPIDHFDNASKTIIELSNLFKKTCPYREAMSLRFRVSHDGELGLWLDASRRGQEDIKKTHSDWIRELLKSKIVIEAGQRQEEWVLSPEDKSIKSTKSKLRPWLASYDSLLNPIPLVSTIASFTQPGPIANRTLIEAGFELVNAHINLKNIKHWGEWGAGNGNLSVAFYSKFTHELVHAKAWISEPDPRSFAALKHNHSHYLREAHIEQSAALNVPQKFDFWLLDPPRSGFSQLIMNLEENLKPEFILIYHCAQKGLISDRDALKQKKYHLKDWIFCDVFPGSPHCESVSLWSL